MSKKRILFVDDDPAVLKLVKAKLGSQLNEWEMSFANDGQKALALMEKTGFDAVVSDIELPKMTGVELLNQVLKRYPHVVRILHSAQTNLEVSFESIDASHQYLVKPWGFKQLKATLCQAFALQDALHNETLKDLVTKLPSLPSLPSTYLELMEELQSEEPSPSKVGEILSRDVAMIAKILKLVNSAYFGLRVTVSDPVHAVKLLGLDMIRTLVLTHGIFSQFTQIDPQALSLALLMQHSLHVGSLAKMIAKAEKQGQDVATDALVAGALHDIGKLILAQAFPLEYKEVVTEAKEQNLPLWLAEKEAFRTSHADVGAYLLGIWGLPAPIVEAVAFHHEPTKGGVSEVRALTTVHAANVIEREEERQEGPIDTSTLDNQYLADVGAGDRVEVWREQWRRHPLMKGHQ